MGENNEIEVVLDGPNGPKVVVTGDWDEAAIEAALPDGWTVGNNWHNGVKLGESRWSYPLASEGA